MSCKTVLRMKDITKEFPGVRALSNVSLTVRQGEILALMGENGAGKSTLMKILSGVYPHKSFNGYIYINDQEVKFHEPKDSKNYGIAIIYQELSLFNDLNVAENIFVGRYPLKRGVIKWSELYYKAQQLLSNIGVDLDISKNVKDIGIGQQQLVEIAKALSLQAKILILDEPTAALTESEVDLLMKILKHLKKQGIAAIFIAHKLNEIFSIADRVAVLRDGAMVGSDQIENLTESKIIKMMVGRELEERYPERSLVNTHEALHLNNFSKYSPVNSSKKILTNINISVNKGEILGISGLMGSGRTELLLSIFGFLKGRTEGKIYVEGREATIVEPRDAITLGLAMVTEDRKRYGLILEQNIIVNSTLASLDKVSHHKILNSDKEIHLANHYIAETGTKTSSVEATVQTLSGGNQQKVLLSRCLMTKPKILCLDEPTRGIDVGAKYEIYNLMIRLAAQGTAIIMVSSEMPEIIGMSHRVIVMFKGKNVGELRGSDITQENIMYKASGGKI